MEDLMSEAHFKSITAEHSAVSPALLTVHDLSGKLNCSTRHIYRLVDTRRIPQPVKLGALLRWVKSDVDEWVANGCPDCRKGYRR
jgi:excisionase family DNA binding protein